MCKCQNCSCNVDPCLDVKPYQERRYCVGQKWLARNGITWEILAVHGDFYWVMYSKHPSPITYRADTLNINLLQLLPKTIKATVISYKYAKSDSVNIHIIRPNYDSNNTVEAWHKAAELGRIIILDEKEIELKCE